jgi:hypothetical protein
MSGFALRELDDGGILDSIHLSERKDRLYISIYITCRTHFVNLDNFRFHAIFVAFVLPFYVCCISQKFRGTHISWIYRFPITFIHFLYLIHIATHFVNFLLTSSGISLHFREIKLIFMKFLTLSWSSPQIYYLLHVTPSFVKLVFQRFLISTDSLVISFHINTSLLLDKLT